MATTLTANETLVFIPGLNCTADLFSAQINALSGNYRIFVANNAGRDSIGDMAQSILNAVHGPLAVAGLSMGGYVALEVVRRAPERVIKLALLDTSAAPDSEEAKRRRRELIKLAQSGQFMEVHRRLWPRLVGKMSLSDEALENRVLEMMKQTGSETFERQQTAIMNRSDARPNLSNIKVPTLIIVGEEDIITPLDVAENMAASIRGSQLVRLSASGHLTTMERPDEATSAMRRWLAASALS